LKRRIDGLLRECELLSAEIARLGDEHEYEVGANRQRIDITDVWRAYLQALLSTKLALVARLQARRAQLDGESDFGTGSGAFGREMPRCRANGNRTAQSE
jgi:hypothetical protein